MRKGKKNILTRIIFGVVMLLFILDVSLLFGSESKAQNEELTKKYDVQIIDEADLLSDEEERLLYQDVQNLTPYGNVIFATVELQGSNYKSYAENTYYKLYGNEPGVIFQIDMGNRKLTLSTSTDMDDIVGKERDSIVDNVYKKATDGKYYECAKECFGEVYAVIDDEKIAHSMKYIDNAIVALTLALILNFVFVFATTRKRVSRKKLLGEPVELMAIGEVAAVPKNVTKKKRPSYSSSGGSHSGGSHSSGGGGGGFSGGSSSHGF